MVIFGTVGRKSSTGGNSSGVKSSALEAGAQTTFDGKVKWLRVCESGEVTYVGGEKPIEIDARLIAATNQSPVEAIARGKLREDLYYRLKVFSIHVPPLRSRGDDIGLLAWQVLQELNRSAQQEKHFSEDVLEALMEYSWPGNVRELKNVVHSAFILADDTIGVEDLPAEVVSGHHPATPAGQGARPGTTVAEAERQIIDATLHYCDGNRKRAAEMLGISVKTLYNRLKDYAEADA